MLGLTLMITRFLSAVRRAWKDPSFRGAVFSLVTIVVAATVFYTLSEGWSVLDSAYFAMSVGLPMGGSAVSPTQTVSKIFTMVYALLVVGLFVSVGASLANALITKNTGKYTSGGRDGEHDDR